MPSDNEVRGEQTPRQEPEFASYVVRLDAIEEALQEFRFRHTEGMLRSLEEMLAMTEAEKKVMPTP